MSDPYQQTDEWPPRWELPPPLDHPSAAQSTPPEEQQHGGSSASPLGDQPAWRPPARPKTGLPSRTPLLAAGAAVFAAVLAVGITLAILQPWAGTPSTSTGAAQPTGYTATVPRSSGTGGGGSGGLTVSANCTSAPSQDAAGNATSYQPTNAVDGRMETAWRCDGDGSGQAIRLSYDSPVTISSVGLVPGLAKTDGFDGTDRYLQSRRISAVSYTFDDGTTVTQNFDTGPYNRSVQRISIPPATTRSVTVTVLGSVSGSQVGKMGPVEKVAVSEIDLSS